VRAVTAGSPAAPSVGAPRSSGSEPRPAGGSPRPPAGKQAGGKAPAPQKPSAEPFNNPFRNLKR
jgi:protein Tex